MMHIYSIFFIVHIHVQDVFPCTAEQFFKLLLDDDSTYTNEFRTVRKDSNLVVSDLYPMSCLFISSNDTFFSCLNENLSEAFVLVK